MNRVLLCLLSFLLTLPVFAGEFENALNTSPNVMLYLSSPTCSYCKKFDPIYSKLLSTYNRQCKFVKLDISTNYGKSIARQCGAIYVPFVILIKSSQRVILPVEPDCLLDYACINKTVNSFVK